VLAVAALLLSGCGGGSSDPAVAGSAGTSSSAPASESQPAGAKSPVRPKAGPEQESQTGESSPPGSAQSAAQASQKQGPRIAQPKGEVEQAPTPAEIANATVADMTLQSPAIVSAEGQPGPLAATYTCDGGGSWPALRWSGVPADTAELILYVMNVAPVEGKLFVDWAVAGLEPSLTGIEAGKLPKGAVIATNSFGKRGYEICPSGGEIYIFAVYALPRALSPQAGFDARELRKEILDVSGNVGLLAASYAHG
jgi:phosphatidylethanolamine-binding protein (PEBP) family uncharacterized protein